MSHYYHPHPDIEVPWFFWGCPSSWRYPPKYRWFIMENPNSKWMMFLGGYHWGYPLWLKKSPFWAGRIYCWPTWSQLLKSPIFRQVDHHESGWWLGHPSEKQEFVNWDDESNPIYGKIKNVPNHQPVIHHVSDCHPIVPCCVPQGLQSMRPCAFLRRPPLWHRRSASWWHRPHSRHSLQRRPELQGEVHGNGSWWWWFFVQKNYSL